MKHRLPLTACKYMYQVCKAIEALYLRWTVIYIASSFEKIPKVISTVMFILLFTL